MTSRQVVTIDGLAASGKSTLAKLLARELGFQHLNTGLLYRGCAYLALKQGLNPDCESMIVDLIKGHSLTFMADTDKASRLLVDGEDCTDSLQSQEVSSFTSKIAALPAVRQILTSIQTEAFPGQPIVAEGRDTGTVIFPQAIVKFFVEGDPLIRASRRAKDLMGHLSEKELERVVSSVAEELAERDSRDVGRKTAPLKRAEDAVVIDNTKGSLETTLAGMVSVVKKKL